MSDAKAAAERLVNNPDGYVSDCWDHDEMEDAAVVARAYLALSAERERVRVMRKRFEEIISDTADGIHDSQSWWSDDHDGRRHIDALLDQLVEAATHFQEPST